MLPRFADRCQGEHPPNPLSQARSPCPPPACLPEPGAPWPPDFEHLLAGSASPPGLRKKCGTILDGNLDCG